MPNDFDAVTAEGLRTAHGIDDEVQRVHDTQASVRSRAIGVDDVQNTVQDTGARVIDGAHVIPIVKPWLSGLLILDYRYMQFIEGISRYFRITSASMFGTRMVRHHCMWLRATQILNLPG